MKTYVFCLYSNKEGLVTINMEISQLCGCGKAQTINRHDIGGT